MKCTPFLLAFALSLNGISAPTQASETDAFTFRYVPFQSGIPAIDVEVNSRIQTAIKTANATSTGCSIAALQKALEKPFLRRLYGKIEGFVNSSPTVSKKRVELSESIYKYVPWYSNLPAHLGLMGFGSVVRKDELLIGSDKFGHFFDQGLHYYLDILQNGTQLQDAMNYGESSENGIFGIQTTGVRSYADMVANFSGAHFWSNMLVPIFEQSNSYLKCEGDSHMGYWVQIRSFTFNEYIDAGWDEGINCSDYKNSQYENEVKRALNELALKHPQHRFDCPIVPEECTALRVKYGVYAERLLNPKCFHH